MHRALILLSLILPAAALARPVAPQSPAVFCETAIGATEHAAGLPPGLMMAIAVTESGRLDAEAQRRRPWPWTINAEGAGYYFATREQAVEAVRSFWNRGVRSIDVGCMQVNLLHHPNAFNSIEAAFDPHTNTRYAAQFLNALFASHGHWHKAIGAYHSATPALGNAYRDLVLTRWQDRGRFVDNGRRSPYGAFAQANAVYAAFDQRSRTYATYGSATR
jgi:hypothetical protein